MLDVTTRDRRKGRRKGRGKSRWPHPPERSRLGWRGPLGGQRVHGRVGPL